MYRDVQRDRLPQARRELTDAFWAAVDADAAVVAAGGCAAGPEAGAAVDAGAGEEAVRGGDGPPEQLAAYFRSNLLRSHS